MISFRGYNYSGILLQGFHCIFYHAEPVEEQGTAEGISFKLINTLF